MARKPKENFYWPLGGLAYGSEIVDYFPDEAQLIGVITILWNRQELALRRIFVALSASTNRAFVEAIWDRQPTHQSKRDMLELAIKTVPLSDHQTGVLRWIVDNTKTLADRRNELIHAEYVVLSHTDQLHAKVKSPRSSKPEKHQKTTARDLQIIVDEMELLLQATEGAWIQFIAPEARSKIEALTSAVRDVSTNRKSD